VSIAENVSRAKGRKTVQVRVPFGVGRWSKPSRLARDGRRRRRVEHSVWFADAGTLKESELRELSRGGREQRSPRKKRWQERKGGRNLFWPDYLMARRPSPRAAKRLAGWRAAP